MKLFRVIGVLLVVLFFGGIAYLGVQPLERSVPPVAGPGVGFGGNLKIPQADVDNAMTYAQSRANDLNQRGRTFATWGSLGTWGSFACTSAITLILGFFGRSPATAGQAPDTTGLATRWARIVGLLAAAAAVLTAAGSLVKDHGQTLYASSDKAVALVRTARADLEADGTTATEQSDVLAELRRQIERL